MFRSLRLKFLILLLAVVAIALVSTILFRHFMLRDFRAYLEGEAEDKVYLIQADLEGSYERYGGWKTDIQAQEAIRALMSGFEMRLTDHGGRLVIDTKSAIENASPLVKKRLEALAQFSVSESAGVFVPYPLFLAGKQLGTLEIRQLRPVREDIFLRRSDGFLMLSMVIVGGLSVLLSILFSRRLTRPVKELALAASAISRGDLQRRVAISRHDEVGKLGESFNHMAKALETQQILRRKLIADVAHELRTPLGVMRGELEGLMDGLIPNDSVCLQSLYDETGRLKNMVDAIEELNKAEASLLSLERHRIDLRSFLRNIVERFRTRFQEGGVVLELICPEGLSLYADPERLSQIILNLLSNALKATPSGGSVSVRVGSTEGRLEITVADSGSGIREEDIPFIFERFYHGPGGGLGIGLTIVKELLEAHGANIMVKSIPGNGSSFTMVFPAEVVHNSS
ncbi:MAG: ATP-binding protein [Syntrophorhabdaceae bacterium]|nr:ATP-binding protein [Syntrophorhabdaceae bacterium]